MRTEFVSFVPAAAGWRVLFIESGGIVVQQSLAGWETTREVGSTDTITNPMVWIELGLMPADVCGNFLTVVGPEDSVMFEISRLEVDGRVPVMLPKAFAEGLRELDELTSESNRITIKREVNLS